MSDELLEKYYEYISFSKRKGTVDMYRWHLDSLNKYLLFSKKSLHNCTDEDIINYIKYNSTWGITVQRHFLSIVKTFFGRYYLMKIPIGVSESELRYKMQRENEVRGIMNIPFPKKESVITYKALSIDEVKLFLRTAYSISEKEYSIFWVLFYTGMRKGEFLGLNPVNEIDWDNNKIMLQASKTKTYVSREICFNEYTKRKLINVWELCGNEHELCEYNSSRLNKMLKKYDKIMGKHIHPHVMRHTFNTLMLMSLKGKLDIDEKMIVRRLMGHKENSVDSMTEVYTSYTNQLKDAMLKYHYMNQL